MSSSTFREPLTPLALNVLSNHAPLKIKVPKRKLSSCSINNTEAEVPFSVYSCEFPLMPNSRNSTLYSPTSNTKYKDLEEPPFPPAGTELRDDPRSPPISPPSTELEEIDKLRKTERLPARKPLQATSPTSPKSPQYRYQLHTGHPTPRTVSDVTGLVRSRSRVNQNPITPPTGEVTVTRKRSRERNAVLGEKAQREDGYSRKFQQARILSDLTHNRGRNASSPRSQYAVFRAEAERVRGLTDLNARANTRANTTHDMTAGTTPATTISTIDIGNSTSFTISTLDKYHAPVAQSYTITTRPAASQYGDRAGRELPRNASQPPSRVIIRGGPRPAFSQRATSEMARRRPSARGRTRSEVAAPLAGNVAPRAPRAEERGPRQRRVWMLRGRVFRRWHKVFARIEDGASLVLMRNGIMKRYPLLRALAAPAPDARAPRLKAGPRLTPFRVLLDGGKVLTFATEYATEADNWIHAIQHVGDPAPYPGWHQLL